TIQPGRRISPDTAAQLTERYGPAATASVADAEEGKNNPDPPLVQAVKTLGPSNPITSAARETPDMLRLMMFALLVGVAITLIPPEAAAPFVNVMQSLFEIVTKIIDIVMQLAP